MRKCSPELIQAAFDDSLSDEQEVSLAAHLSNCQLCRDRLDQAAAPTTVWADVANLLDPCSLDDPESDLADSSAIEARVFEGDDPVGDLRAAGVIADHQHPEVLGQLGRYSIEREIGVGGMGVVLKGHDPELNRTVAIKVLAPHLARSGAARQRFVRESRAAAAVVHENVVAIHQVDTSGPLPNLVMQFIDGVSLQRHVDTFGPLPIGDAIRIAAQAAAGLAAAHRQGIVHRDVKPGNILIGGSGQRIWITDFGLARAVDDASLTRTGFIAGTPHYMSPEQARGGSIGPESDLFSLGAVIYFMLAARPPWRAERSLAVLHRIVQETHRPLWQVNPDVPREVSDLVDQLLEKTSAKRLKSASDTQSKLESLLSDYQHPHSPRQINSGLVPAMSQDKKPSFFARPLFVVPTTALFTAACVLLFTQLMQPSVSPRVVKTRNSLGERFITQPLPQQATPNSLQTAHDRDSFARAIANEDPSPVAKNGSLVPSVQSPTLATPQVYRPRQTSSPSFALTAPTRQPGTFAQQQTFPPTNSLAAPSGTVFSRFPTEVSLIDGALPVGFAKQLAEIEQLLIEAENLSSAASPTGYDGD